MGNREARAAKVRAGDRLARREFTGVATCEHVFDVFNHILQQRRSIDIAGGLKLKSIFFTREGLVAAVGMWLGSSLDASCTTNGPRAVGCAAEPFTGPLREWQVENNALLAHIREVFEQLGK